jgi:hypothetical protein
MTVPELEDALVEFIQMNTSEFRYRSNQETQAKIAPQVYAAFVPRDVVGDIIPGEINHYPAIVVRARQGVQSEKDYERVTVEILIGLFNDELDQGKAGNRDCLQLVERLKQRLREQSIIRQKFPIRMPLNWQIARKPKAAGGAGGYNTYPYFFGEIQVDFQVPVPPSQYEATYMSPDVMVGRYNVPMKEEEVTPHEREHDVYRSEATETSNSEYDDN